MSTVYQKLENATGLNVTYEPSDLTIVLSWNKIATPNDIITEFGDLGYKIYKDDTYIGFTTESTYKISDVINPNGTYKVVTGYKDSQNNDSIGITYKLEYEDPSRYEVKLLVPSEKTYQVGAL